MTNPVLYVDFNDTDERRNVIALRSRENSRVQVGIGDLVELRDEDGFHVEGLVCKVTKAQVVVAPDWGTWWNPDAVRLTPAPDEPDDDMVVALLDTARTAGTQTLAGR